MQIEGRAHFSKAAMLCPWLKYPITNLGGSVHLADGALMVPPFVPKSHAGIGKNLVSTEEMPNTSA